MRPISPGHEVQIRTPLQRPEHRLEGPGKLASAVPKTEGTMSKFRDIKTLQKFACVHATIHNHFNFDRHLDRRSIFKRNRSAALIEWRQLAA